MRKRLAIYGAGGLGREVLSMVKGMDDWEPYGFFDDVRKKGTSVAGLPVLGGIAEASANKELQLVIALGSPADKQALHLKLKSYGLQFPVLIHPSVIIQNKETVLFGAGCIITAGCVLTTDIQVGEHVLINLNSTVGHDCKIQSYSSIMPGVNLAGGVAIGEAVLVGSGSNILNKVRVGDRTVIGMGSVVLRDLAAHSRVAGVPAKPIQS